MPGKPAPARYRNIRFLFQLWFRIRVGRLGTSARIPTERDSVPQGLFAFWLVAGLMVLVGWLASFMWLWIAGALLFAVTMVWALWPALPTASYSKGYMQALKTGGPGGRQKRTFARITAKDPEFDGSEFLERVRRAYVAAHEAWNEGQLGLIRPFVSDGVFERFRMARAELEKLPARPRLRDARVVQCFVIHGYAEEKLDVNTVRIDVLGDAESVDEAGRLLELPVLAARYTEYWTLVRRAEARTHKGRPGLLEGNCPNCGAEVTVNQAASCEHCGVTLRSGEHDWVLVEVTQMGRWRSVDPSQIPGVHELQQVDPCFSVACFEDRAAVVFWQLEEAARIASTDGLGSQIAPALRDLYASRIHPGAAPPELGDHAGNDVPADETQYIGERLVEAVDTIGIKISEQHQHALVSVSFSGRLFGRRAGGPPERRSGFQGRTLLLFERPAAAATELDRGLSSAHCESCAAPLTGGSVCSFCSAPIAPGDGWALVATSHLAPKGIPMDAITQELLAARTALRHAKKSLRRDAA